MTQKSNNVIQFPAVKNQDPKTTLKMESLDFADDMIDGLHDIMHYKSDVCIFEDAEYEILVKNIHESLTAMNLIAEGHKDLLEDSFNNHENDD